MQAANAQADAAQANADYSAAISRNRAAVAAHNALLADRDALTAYQNAGLAGFRGQERSLDQDLAASDQIGQFVTEQAASGTIGGGRAVQSLQRLASRDRLRIRQEGDAEAAQFRRQGEGFEAEANDLRTGAASARADAQMSLLTGRHEAAMARAQGFSSLISGFAGGAGLLLDGSQSPSVRHDLSGARDWFRRRFPR